MCQLGQILHVTEYLHAFSPNMDIMDDNITYALLAFIQVSFDETYSFLRNQS